MPVSDASPPLPPYGAPPAYPLALSAPLPPTPRPFRDALAWHLAGGAYRTGVVAAKVALVGAGAYLLYRAWGRLTTWLRTRGAGSARDASGVGVRDVTPAEPPPLPAPLPAQSARAEDDAEPEAPEPAQPRLGELNKIGRFVYESLGALGAETEVRPQGAVPARRAPAAKPAKRRARP